MEYCIKNRDGVSSTLEVKVAVQHFTLYIYKNCFEISEICTVTASRKKTVICKAVL